MAADIRSGVEPAHHVHETDRIHIEHRRRIRVIADLRRITRHQEHVADAHRVRAQQIRLHPEQTPVAARVVEDRFHA